MNDFLRRVGTGLLRAVVKAGVDRLQSATGTKPRRRTSTTGSRPQANRSATGRTGSTTRTKSRDANSGTRPRPGGSTYPGDFTGQAVVRYAPRNDAKADPGEVVWTWVPYEEDHSQGKDRPVLVVAEHGQWLLGLMLTSKDHDIDQAQEARYGRHWLDIGSGQWDRSGRASEVRIDRVLTLDPTAVRREGGRLDAATFDLVAKALCAEHGWSRG